LTASTTTQVIRFRNFCHAASSTLSLMCGFEFVSIICRKASCVMLSLPTQMMRAVAGKSLATSRAYIAGKSLRIARSPLPPKKTRSKSEIAMGV
jgi:hypothetical protein